jgi:hypothetical protein
VCARVHTHTHTRNLTEERGGGREGGRREGRGRNGRGAQERAGAEREWEQALAVVGGMEGGKGGERNLISTGNKALTVVGGMQEGQRREGRKVRGKGGLGERET